MNLDSSDLTLALVAGFGLATFIWFMGLTWSLPLRVMDRLSNQSM